MKWWEKTVEYYFIRKFIPKDMILSPLDGNEEKAGDTFLSANDKWIIIEFKKDLKSLKSEAKKYKNYNTAKKQLRSLDGHHFLIWGHVKNEEFGLAGRTYFSNQAVSNIKDIFEAGKEKGDFISYLKKLIKHKTKVGESSGGSIGSYSFVAGINEKNEITSCMNLYEFGLDHGLKLEPSPSFSKKNELDYV